ncbi:MAG: putative holin-like toxin [Paenibacillaceae bacterium]
MEVKDAITIMILFGTFIVVLLTYISNNNKRK